MIGGSPTFPIGSEGAELILFTKNCAE